MWPIGPGQRPPGSIPGGPCHEDPIQSLVVRCTRRADRARRLQDGEPDLRHAEHALLVTIVVTIVVAVEPILAVHTVFAVVLAVVTLVGPGLSGRWPQFAPVL